MSLNFANDICVRPCGGFRLIPIGHDLNTDLPARRWMAVIQWYEPGDTRGFPHFRCRRTVCPLRLARWCYLVAARVAEKVREVGR